MSDLRPSQSLSMKSVHPRAPKSAPQTKLTKGQLERFLKIHDHLNDAWHGGRHVNCSTLAEKLAVSPKTIQRDLEFLRDRLELPIAYDASEKSFSYTEEQPHFPIGPQLSIDERIALVVGRQALQVFEGVGLGKELQSAFDKITGGMLSEQSALVSASLEKYLSVRTPGAGRIKDPAVFQSIRRALLGHFELRVEYQKKGNDAPTQRRLHPYHLSCVENRWVLVALDAEKNAVQTYVLARFKKSLATKTKFQRPADFDPKKHFGTSFGVWTGTGAIEVRLRIGAAGAHQVVERKWHDTQRETLLPNGEVEVTFKLGDLNDITRWILGLGSDCEVLEPAELRAAIAAEGKKMS